MSEPVEVTVVGQVLPGSVLRVDPSVIEDGWDPLMEGLMEGLRASVGHSDFLVVAAERDGLDLYAPPAEGDPTRPMPVDEFRALGLLQEVNRRLLHPLGLKLGWQTGMADDTLVVWDDRGDPEGVRFEGIDLAAGVALVEALWEQRRPEREAALGYMVQPAE